MKAIIFQGQKVSRTKVKNNILKVWGQCTTDDKYDWYAEAREFAESLDTTLNKACGIIAALSPLVNWKRNKTIAELFVNGQRKGLHTTLCVGKAERILASDGKDETILAILNGQKIKSFFINIRYPNEVQRVTIDRHALSIAIGTKLTDEKMRITPKQYEFFNHCYMLTADVLDISPLILQSATWVRWRKFK